MIERWPTVFCLFPGTSAYPHSTALVSWASQEELDIDSSNEDDDTRNNPDETMEGDPASNPGQSTK